MTRNRASAVLLALLSIGAAVGCSDEDLAGEAEAGVAAVLAERLAVPAQSVDVTCPDDLDLEPGATFGCDVAIVGDVAAADRYAVDLAVGDDGSIELQRAVIPTDAAAAYLASELGPTAEGPVTVNCGTERLIIRSVGETFECTATRTADGVQFHVVVDVTAVDGSVSYRVERTTTTTTTATTGG
jgi:hypothetical protein